MSHVTRAMFGNLFLWSAFGAAVVGCSAGASSSEDEPLGTTSQAKEFCPVGTYPSGTKCLPITCAPGYEEVDGKCIPVDCPAGEINTGTACVLPPPPTCPVVSGGDEVANSSGACVPCGLAGVPICTSASTAGYTAACTQAGTISNGVDCTPCGAATQPVCASGNCTQNNTVSVGGTCTLCGGLNEAICSSPTTPNFSTSGECNPSSVNSNGTCLACGLLNQLVCNATSNAGVFKGPCTQLNTASNGTDCVQECVFDPSCPPGMYNTTPPLVNPVDNVTPCNPAAGCHVGGYQTPLPPGSAPGTGFVPASSAVGAPIEPYGCTFAAPALTSCRTTGNITVTNAQANTYTYTNTAQIVPKFQAPIVTSVVLGGTTVYAIVSPPPGQPGESVNGGPNAVFAWGDNEFSQLGNGATSSSQTPQVPIYYPPIPAAAAGGTAIPANNVVQLVAGIEDACALLSDGSVHCWGTWMTYPGPQTWPTDTVVAFPADTTTGIVPGNPNGLTIGADPIVQITHGAHHACALTSTGNVYCWGNNDRQQLGLPLAPQQDGNLPQTTEPFEIPLATNATPGVTPIVKVTAIAASGNTSCMQGYEQGEYSATNPALDGPQWVYCWGDDAQGSASIAGQSIDGNAWSSNTYTQVATGAGVTNLTGASLGGQGLYGSFCAYVGALGAGEGGTSDGWFCWGANDQQQLDWSNNALNGFAAENVPLLLGDATLTISGLPSTGIEYAPWLILGESHSCAQGITGAYCFGGNGDGQLGLPVGPADFATAIPAAPSAFPPGSSFTTPLANPPAGSFGVSPLAVGNDLTCGIYVAAEPVYNPGDPANNVPASGTPGSYGVVDAYGNVIGNATGNIACWGGGSSGLVSSSTPTPLSW